MTWLLIIISILIFISVLLTLMSLYKIIYRERIELEKRIDGLVKYGDKQYVIGDDDLSKSFADRIVKPVLNRLGSITARLFPKNNNEFFVKQLLLAGNPFGLNAKEFGSLYIAVSIILGSGMLLIAVITRQGALMQIVGVIWGAILGRVFVSIYLKMLISNRQQAISRGLPDVLDLLTVSVEAGLGFDMAIQKVVGKTKGPLAEEFGKTLQEIKMGKPRKEALRDLGNRTGVENLNSLLSAIIQVDQLGVSIGNVLRTQSKQMRLLQKQRIEEKAMKAPIKMLIPMVLFIFPTVFIVLLGPAVLQLIEVMK